MRNKLLDQIRLIAAFMVVLIHAPLPGKAGQVFEAISRVAVPLFFMVSGYYALGKSKEKLLKSARKTAIMLLWSVGVYFVWGVLWSLYKRTTAEYLIKFFSAKSILETFVFNNGVILGHLWFLLALLYCYLIYTYILRKASPFVQTTVSAVLLISFFVVRELLKISGVSNPVYYLRNFMFVGIPFFLIGGLVNRYKEHLINLATPFWVGLMCVGVAVTLVERFSVDCCDLYAGTIIAAVALFVFAQKPGLIVGNMLAEMGEKYAGDIYIFHSLIITLLNAAASVVGILSLGVFTWIRPVIVFIASIAVSYLRIAIKKKMFKNSKSLN